MKITMRVLRALVIASASLGATQQACAALTDNLVGLYEFQNNFLDTSGSPQSSHGTPVNGPQFTAGKIGQGMLLTGVRDYMSLDPATLTELDFGSTVGGDAVDFSAAMWIRQDNFLTDPAVFSNKDWDNGDNTGINWAVKGNGVFDLNTKGNVGVRRDLDTAANSVPLTVGAWNLVVMTVDRDGPTRLFINGVNTGTIPASSLGDFNGGLPWVIGQDGTGQYGVEYTGAVDELAIWRRAISPAEAGQLWNGGAGINLGDLAVELRLKLVVDRDSGRMTIENNTGAVQNVIGYQIGSAAGAFNRTAWKPIAGRLDDAGNGTVDPDDNWVVLSPSTTKKDLSEVSLGEAAIGAGAKIDLGVGVWEKYFQDDEDVQFLYADPVGDVPVTGIVEFIGGPLGSYAFGDLDFDGDLDSEDWTTLASRFSNGLTNLTSAQRYRSGDLNDDGRHALDDILEFRLAYDTAHGAGAFAAMVEGVPEPSGEFLAAAALAGLGCVLVGRRRKGGQVMTIVAIVGLAFTPAVTTAGVLFQQNFDGIALGSSVNETPAAANVWSATPPAGWAIDNAGVPTGGVTEWRGWSFASPSWWATVAQDQGRTQFTKASGAIAVADPDEWDDLAHDPGSYNTFLRTPAISLTGVPAGAAKLRFDSSWMPEVTQTANLAVSYNGGADVEVFRWTSVNGDANFKAAATNETVVVPLNNPAGATSMTLEFGLFDAGNNWWWAIDNVVAFTPLTLQVDATSGAMTLLGDSSVALTGYEISSPDRSLNPVGWRAGNLDAQNVGAASAHAADFDLNNSVGASDLAAWRTAFGSSGAADADDDGDSDGADFLRWQRSFGATTDPGSTWLTFLATDGQLIESYLYGSSTFAVGRTLGVGYNTAKDRRDLTFTYTTLAGEKAVGAVTYVNLPPGTAQVPEPRAAMLALLAWAIAARVRLRKVGSDNSSAKRKAPIA